jgi:hypothetical protein
VLEEGYDWYVKWLDLDPRSLAEPGFLKLFTAWKDSVMKYQVEKFAQVEARLQAPRNASIEK